MDKQETQRRIAEILKKEIRRQEIPLQDFSSSMGFLTRNHGYDKFRGYKPLTCIEFIKAGKMLDMDLNKFKESV